MSVTKDRRLFRRLVALGVMATGAASLAYWYVRPVRPWRKVDEEAVNTPRAHSLLQTYLPKAEFAGEVAVNIQAPAEAIYDAMQRVTVDDMPIAKFLGTLRYLPARFGHSDDVAAPPKATKPFLQQVQTEGGNILLGERPGVETVLGAIGKFHCLADQQFVPLRAPHEYVAFDEPDYQKLVMSFQITPLPDGTGHCLRLVHGTHALSAASRWKFALYWLAIKPGGNFVSWIMLRAIKSIAETSSVAATLVRA